MTIKMHLKTISLGIIRMEVHENGDIEIEYCDVNDDELIALVQTYPNLLDDSNNTCERYKHLVKLVQLNGGFLNDSAFDEITMR
jgi:hypothetical protein